MQATIQNVQDMETIVSTHDVGEQVKMLEIPFGSDSMFSDECIAFVKTEKRYNLNSNDYDIISFYLIIDPVERLVYEASPDKISCDSFEKYLIEE